MSLLPDAFIRADSAAMFGKLGREVEQALAAFHAAPIENTAVYEDLLHAAADAVWRYFVVREACNLNDHTPLIEAYQIPREVLARVGSPKPSFPR